jgi:hypothetical protein
MQNPRRIVISAFTAIALSVLGSTATAEEGANSDATELAKKLSNPISCLISVPLQFNYDEGFGPADAGRYTLNIQPVVPVTLNDDWNVIVRTILPVIYADSVADGVDSKFGLGDTVLSLFLSPQDPTANGWIWGAGPVFLLPTATDDQLGGEQWGAGPTAVLLRQENGWTYGLLANHVWSFAGDDDRADVNATFLQPFLSYTFPTATTVTLNTESTYDWNESEWTIPINLQASQLVRMGGQPVQLSLAGRYYADSPEGGPEWGVRFTFTLLFPK